MYIRYKKKTYEMKYSPGKPSPELITHKNSICKKKKLKFLQNFLCTVQKW